MGNLTLYELTAEMQQIEDELIENGGELTEDLEARMAETAEALPAKVDGYHHIVRRMEAQAEAFTKARDEFATKARVCKNSVSRIKDHLAGCMVQFGIKKLEGDMATVTLRSSEALDLMDEGAVLDAYTHGLEEYAATLPDFIRVEVKVDKTALKAAIKAGKPVVGAALTTNYSAVIR